MKPKGPSIKMNKMTTLIICVAVILVSVYSYLANRETPAAETVENVSQVQDLLLRNLETNYPSTPKEVLKYYSEITSCFYNEAYTEDEKYALAMKIRELYDEELKATQTEEQYLEKLNEDIDHFKKNGITISNYAISASVDVEYKKINNQDWAWIYCVYSLKQGKGIEIVNEKFVLRKDEDGHYKILGWELAGDADK